MTQSQIEELKEVARAAIPKQMDTGLKAAKERFHATFNPERVLSLLSELERLQNVGLVGTCGKCASNGDGTTPEVAK